MSWPFSSSVHAQLQPHWLCPSPLLSVHSDHSRMSPFPKQLCHCSSSPSQVVIVSHCFPGLPQQPVLTSVISWMTLSGNNCWQPIANCTRSCWRARALPKHLDICRVPPTQCLAHSVQEMYHFFLLNSNIVRDAAERYVLEPTTPDLQLEVRYVGKRKGRKGVEIVLCLNCRKNTERAAQFWSF